MVYRAALPPGDGPATAALTYRDGNYPERAGWKEIVATAAPGVTLVASTVPERDRSRELADYPTDPAESPPQALEAQVVFARAVSRPRSPPLAPPPARRPATRDRPDPAAAAARRAASRAARASDRAGGTPAPAPIPPAEHRTAQPPPPTAGDARVSPRTCAAPRATPSPR